MADAYLINPVLNAERARLRATDEQVALAKSGLRPFISGSADSAFLNTNTQRSTTGGTTPSDVGALTGPVKQHSQPMLAPHRSNLPLTKHSVRAKSVRTTA